MLTAIFFYNGTEVNRFKTIHLKYQIENNAKRNIHRKRPDSNVWGRPQSYWTKTISPKKMQPLCDVIHEFIKSHTCYFFYLPVTAAGLQ